MNFSKISYKIGCWAFIVVGVGHIVTDLLGPKTSKQMGYIQTMKDSTLSLLGTDTTVFSFYQGFSIMMGLLLTSYGLINLLIVKNNKESNVAKNIILLNILVASACVILSIKYFFIVPITLTGLAFIGFTLSLIQQRNT